MAVPPHWKTRPRDPSRTAIATFERTLLSGNSAYDRYKAGNKSVRTPAQVRGMDVYFNQASAISAMKA
jgi:cytochrome c peroxidase